MLGIVLFDKWLHAPSSTGTGKSAGNLVTGALLAHFM